MRASLGDLSALESYWSFQRENQNVLLGIPDEREIRERLVNKLTAERIVRMYARKRGIAVSEQEVVVEWERLKEKPESEAEIAQFLRTAYQWSDARFIERVLEPFLLQQKVKNALVQEFGSSDEDLEQEALSVYVLALEEGADFDALARQNSYDARTADQGGDLGYFGRGVLEPALEQAIFGMKIGEVSAPVKSSFGYHVIKLEDLLYDGSGVAVKARARHILIREFNFDEWVEQQKRELAIFRLVR
ncbi:MAG: peptidylprolyl isomerase [Parcubacteria group bacterium]|nr:peptidylprolyl isomerase [Parcubacteria group bacterium]